MTLTSGIIDGYNLIAAVGTTVFCFNDGRPVVVGVIRLSDHSSLAYGYIRAHGKQVIYILTVFYGIFHSTILKFNGFIRHWNFIFIHSFLLIIQFVAQVSNGINLNNSKWVVFNFDHVYSIFPQTVTTSRQPVK